MKLYPIVLVIFLAACSHSQGPVFRGVSSSETFKNPVFQGAAPFADPAIIRAQDGLYYAYATQSRNKGHIENVQVLSSRDLVSWEKLPDALPRKPLWADKRQNFWAPHVAYIGGKYLMYISAEQNELGYCIGVGVAQNPAGPFENFKRLVCGPSFKNIDPMSFVDPQTHRVYLFWGSGHFPLIAQEMTADGMAFAENSSKITVLENLREPRGTLEEKGWTYAFGTQMGHEDKPSTVQAMRSKDKIRWEKLPDAMPLRPLWASGKPDHWAPQVVKKGKNYLMYLAVETVDKKFCLSVARARKPEGPYAVVRKLECSKEFKLVNPYLKELRGQEVLVWEHPTAKKLVYRELDPQGLGFSSKLSGGKVSMDHLTLAFRRSGYENLVEGAWVTHKHGYYYLYYSGDDCCSEDAHYAVSVARARHPLGPYEKNGVILKGNHRWKGPGHNSVIEDGKGSEWILYHAIPAEKFHIRVNEKEKEVNRVLLLDKIDYSDTKWPVLRSLHPRSTVEEKPSP
ncbi:MAG TPA: family 43 glycosylhydrolase [Bacteriovoracaceae bacterium]|nr:family 43 glycosylhydrolase [Bacteriovoracaceae bacterium]